MIGVSAASSASFSAPFARELQGKKKTFSIWAGKHTPDAPDTPAGWPRVYRRAAEMGPTGEGKAVDRGETGTRWRETLLRLSGSWGGPPGSPQDASRWPVGDAARLGRTPPRPERPRGPGGVRGPFGAARGDAGRSGRTAATFCGSDAAGRRFWALGGQEGRGVWPRGGVSPGCSTGRRGWRRLKRGRLV